MSDQLKERIQELLPRTVETRRHLHRHPERSDHEVQTAALVARRLTDLGIEPRTGVGGHGVVADIVGRTQGPMIALRADMDALPIQEETGLPYASANPGVMHACGHDGHTAMMLGVAEVLVEEMRTRAGTVRLLFQPAEETVGGAPRMIADGALEGVQAVVALHGWRHLPVGHIGVMPGPCMAGADVFDITVRGRGAHAAYPHQSSDPIVTAARIVTALQTVVSRETDPLDPAVLTVARISGGTAYNIIPDTAHLAGTVRTLSRDVADRIEAAIRRIVAGECAAADAAGDVVYHHGSPPVVNDPAIVELIRDAALLSVGPDAVTDLLRPSMGAEDFAYMLQAAPGAMYRLGIGDGAPGHNAGFDFDDRAIPVGIESLCRTALMFVERHTARP